MELPVEEIGRAARGWTVQGEDLRAAADQLGAAASTGFTAPVAGAADRFTEAWRRHTADLAAGAEARGGALRVALGAVLYADAEAAGASDRVADRLADRWEHRR